MLATLGIRTAGEMLEHGVEVLHIFTEKTAFWLLETCLGLDEHRDIASERKSYSRETTFSCVDQPTQLLAICEELCDALAHDMLEVCLFKIPTS